MAGLSNSSLARLKQVLVLLLLFLLTTVLPGSVRAQSDGTQLGNLAASMSPRTWAQLSTVNVSILLKPNTGDILEYANRGAWDPVGKRLFYCGASHHDTFQAGCVMYSAGMNSWSSIPLPLPDGSIGHGYDHNTFDTVRGKFYFRNYNEDIVRRYDPTTEMWTALPPIPWIGGSACAPQAGSLVYYPNIDRIVFLNARCGYEAYYYNPNPVVESWTAQLLNLPDTDLAPEADYLRTPGVVAFSGPAPVSTTGMAKLSCDPCAPTPIAEAPTFVDIADSLLTVDPPTNRLLLLSCNGSMYQYDPVADRWSVVPGVPSQITPCPSPVSGGFSAIAVALPNYGVTMVVVSNNQPPVVWLYKHGL